MESIFLWIECRVNFGNPHIRIISNSAEITGQLARPGKFDSMSNSRFALDPGPAPFNRNIDFSERQSFAGAIGASFGYSLWDGNCYKANTSVLAPGDRNSESYCDPVAA